MDIRNDLIPLNASPLPALFHDADAMNKVLAQINRDVLAETADPATEDGRAAIKRLAYKVSRGKTALDDVGKPLADAAREDWDAINAIRKTAKEFFNALRDKVRQPLTDWEAAEKKRIEAIEDRLTAITAMGEVETFPSEAIERAIGQLEALAIGDDWQEFAEKAAEEKSIILEYLCRTLKARGEAEAKEAELEALRAEAAERYAADAERAREAAIAERENAAAENARKQAEIAAESALEREKERGQREFDRAQREVADANLRAEKAAAAERERAERFEIEKREARAKREMDDENRAQVFSAVARALESDPVRLKPHDALKVVGAISDKLIPHLTINF